MEKKTAENAMYHFYAYLSRMKHIERWGLMHSVQRENIQEHSLSVTMLAHALALIKEEIFGERLDVEKTVLYALYHETSEVLTGDLPTPIKYFNAEINAAYKSLENVSNDKLLSMLPDPLRSRYAPLLRPDRSSPEYRVVKLADKLDAYLKCVEELKVGNREFKKAKASISRELKAANDSAVDYFLENFASSYERTLDELD